MKIISDRIYWIKWLYENHDNYLFGQINNILFLEKYKKYIQNSNWVNFYMIQKIYNEIIK